MHFMKHAPRRYAVSLRIALVMIAIGFAVAPVAEARKAWDQETVTGLAAQLAEATKALEKTLRREPHLAQATQGGDRNAMGLWEAMNRLKKSTAQLRTRTAAGAGYEETLPIAKKIRTLVRDAEERGSRLMKTETMDAKIAPVQDLLDRLAPYYF